MNEIDLQKYKELITRYNKDTMKYGPKFEMDRVATYSVTSKDIAIRMAVNIKNCYPDVKVIYDACACVGGNTIAFSHRFTRVYASEIDPIRYDILKKNLRTYGCLNTVAYLGSCFDIIPDINADLIFIDGPWDGGREYKKIDLFTIKNNVKLDGDFDCEYLLKLAIMNRHIKYIVVKLPLSYNETEYPGLFYTWWRFRNQKYGIIIKDKLKGEAVEQLFPVKMVPN